MSRPMSRNEPLPGLPASLLPLLLCTLACVLACGGRGPEPIPLDDLVPVPAPELRGLPESGQELLKSKRSEFDRLLERAETADGDISKDALALAFGELGEHYHAYGLHQASLAAYANAHTLDPEEPRWPYLAAVLHQVDGRRDAALAELGRALELDDDDRPTRLRLVELHLAANEIDRAASLLEPIRGDSTAAVHYAAGRIANAREQSAEAIEHFESALELQPEARNLHSLLATLYQRTGNRQKAEYHVAEIGGGIVIFDDPRIEAVNARVVGVGPILDRALEAYGDEDYAASAEAYLEALELEPDNPTALRGAAGSLREGGRIDEALRILRRFTETHPENRLARLELGTTLVEANRIDEALPLLRQLTTEQADFQQAFVNYGVALTRAERFADAEAAFERALELDPFDQVTRFQLSIAQRGRGDDDAAVRTLEKIIAEAPTFVRARQHLGEMLRELGRPERAAEHFAAVAELEEAAPQERALARYQLGSLAISANRLEEAIDHLEASVELFPDLWQARMALGNRYRDADRQLEAAEQYAVVARLQPELALARVEEARAWARGGRPAQALERLEEGRRELPRAAEIANLQARLLATVEDENLRDGRRALALATDLVTGLPRPEHAETLAMALAAVGDFERALAQQQNLVEQVRGRGSVRDLRRLEDNLERYRRRQLARPF